MTPLKTPESHNAADQCREMGLAVGDVVEGRETYGADGWGESRLTLIFLGKDVAVFREARRNDQQPDWMDGGESACWTLTCRAWREVEIAA